MKYRKLAALLLLLLVIALAGAVGWLGGTTSGLRFLAGLALPRLPVTLDPGEIEGRLVGPVSLGRLEIDTPGFRAELAGLELDWRPRALLGGTFHATDLRLARPEIELREPAPGAAATAGAGSPFSLPFEVIVERLAVTGGALRAGDDAPVVTDVDLEVSGRAAGRRLVLQGLELASSRGRAAGNAQLSLDPAEAWDIDLRWQLPLAGEELAGHTRARGPLAELAVSQDLSAPLAARLDGIVRGLPGPPSWAVDLVVEPLPPGGELWPEAIAGLAARLRVEGDLEDSSVAGDVELPRYLPGPTGIAARAGWVDDVVRLDSLELTREDGMRLGGSGTVAADAATLALDFSGLDPATFWPEWPGRLAGSVRLSGLPSAASGLDIRLQALRGELRSVPLSGEADLNVGADQYVLRQARISAGGASLNASGRLDPAAVALTAALDVPALATLHPDAAGALRASARLAGTRQAPTLELEAAGRDLRWQSQRVQALELAVAGSAQAHRARLELDRPGLDQAFLLTLEGAFADRRWNALLTDVVFSAAGEPAWSLQAPARLAVDSEVVSLGEACMDGSFGLLCLEGDWRRSGPLRGSATLARLDLAPLSQRFTPGLRATGVLSGDVDIQADGERFQALAGRVELTAGELRLADEEDKALLSWARGLLELTGDGDAARAELSLALADADHVDGRLALGWNRPDLPIAGRIEATLGQVHLLPALVPELAELKGDTTLRATIGGTLGAPSLEAELALRDGSVNMPRLGLRPDQLEALVTLAGRELGFTITGRSGAGLFRTEGRFDLAAEGVAGRATLSGEQLLLVNLAEARVAASPDLEFSYTGRALEISGEVAIPFARITELGGATTVSASPDEVLVGAYVPAESQGLRVTSRVRVTVGPDVQLDAAGLRGGVEGSLLTVIQPDALPWGRGELRVVDGTFGAFGQRLEIEQGRLIYTGGPLDNPGLEIRAVRRLEEVTAGALVRGTLQQPEISVYSEPPMPQAEALAYLTLGRSLADLRSGEQRVVNQAANSLALSGGNLIAKDLGQRLGFADVALAAESEGTSLVVSRYLGGGLYVGYGIGLFDTVNTLRLRLQVNQRLSLETISGDEHAGDLFYTFERD
ncbi:translocation/assembly module TamB domain-containing protein [Thioalkalivibrio sp. XN8]|uniref:translocation/assembly module TamB domain-containing protein n=1 Tax=Thioalkalivibrio sp. XN8 TaxID=2712863 RepID=UPI0013EB858E|nr:hypothetical protein [Thioalkalivibrio sp. XN8]